MPIAIPIQGNFDGSLLGEKIRNLGAGTDPGDAVNKAQLDAATAFNGNMQGAKITNLGTGTAATDATTKGQVDTSLAGKADLVAGKVPVGQIPALPYVPATEKGTVNGVATLDGTGKVPAAQLPLAPSSSPFAFKFSASGSVNLNSLSEQAILIAHGQSVRPPALNMLLIDVMQDNPAVDTSAVRWTAGYPIYDEAGSTATNARVLVRFSTGVGTAATGRARIFFAL